jgi:hypothetical protein
LNLADSTANTIFLALMHLRTAAAIMWALTLRRIYPDLLTFEEYLRKSGWENAEPMLEGGKGWG